jgi:hypothetical protein
MKPKYPTDAEVTDEMERIKRDAAQKMADDDKRGELAFFRLLRSAFTDFLEGKPWVKEVGTEYWHGEDSSNGRFGLWFEIQVDHPNVVDLEVVVNRGPN